MSEVIYQFADENDVVWKLVQMNWGEYRIYVGNTVKYLDIKNEDEGMRMLSTATNTGHGT